jgi:integrase
MPKRRGPRGMGTVYQPTYKLKDGTNRKSKFYWIRFTDERGKRHIESSGYTTKDGARQLLTERLAKIHKGEFAEYAQFKDITLKQVTDGLRAYYKAMGRRSTRKVERNLDNVDKFFGETFRADTLTAERLADYRAQRLKEGIKVPTITHEFRSLKTALRLALRDGKIRRMPVIQILADPNRKDDGEFTKDQIKALLVEAPAYMRPLIRFLYTTGMRVMEPANMTWSEVNLKHGELRISGRRTKNGQQKVLYLSGEPLEVLKGQKVSPHCDRVFVDADGQPLRYDAILEDFQQACKRAKIVDGFTDADNGTRLPGFHDLRRTFARVANRAGVPHGIIMEIAGWKSEAMLLRYLGNSRPAEQRAAFERLELSTG